MLMRTPDFDPWRPDDQKPRRFTMSAMQFLGWAGIVLSGLILYGFAVIIFIGVYVAPHLH